MHAHTHERRDYDVVLALAAGTFVGAGLIMWFAPRTVFQLRDWIADATQKLRQRRYAQPRLAPAGVGETVDALIHQDQCVCDDIAAPMPHSVSEVAHYATVGTGSLVSELRS